MIYKVFVFLVVSNFLTTVAHSAPVVIGTSGTVGHGNQIQISGTGFGTKDPAKPYFWAPMEGSANPSTLGTMTTWDDINDMAYAAGCGPNGTGCLQGDAGNKIWAAKVTDTGNVNWAAPGQKTYLYRKLKANFSIFEPAPWNWKSWRVWGKVVETNQDTSIMIGDWNGSFAMDHEVESGGGLWPFDAECSFGPVNQWNTSEILMRVNTNGVGEGDGFLQQKTNGASCGQVPYLEYWGMAQFKIWDSSKTLNLREHYVVHGVRANHDMGPNDRYSADDVYLDTTWARVMLSNRATWGTSSSGSLYEIQIPTSWSATSITVRVNHGELSNGTVYLYVVDADGTVNATGYPVTLTDSGAATPL